MDYFVYIVLGVSLSANVVLAFRQIKKKHVLNVDAKKLLHDLTAGGATIDIRVLDTSNLFYRSPRG